MSDSPKLPSAALAGLAPVLLSPPVLLIGGGLLLLALLGRKLGGAVQAVGEGTGQGARGLLVGVAQGSSEAQRVLAVGLRDTLGELAKGDEVTYVTQLEAQLKPRRDPPPAWAKQGTTAGKIDSVSIARDDLRTKYDVRWTVANMTETRRTVGSVAQLQAVAFGSRTQRETPNQADALEPGELRSHSMILEGPVFDALNTTTFVLWVDGRDVDRRGV